jgi:hypothetical protein
MAARSKREAERIAAGLLAEVEFLRQEAHERGERFEALGKEQLVEKLMREPLESPFFNAQGWGSTSPGGSTTYTAFVQNPDPVAYSGFFLFGYLFFGPANFIGGSDAALTVFDERFPRFYQRCGVAANSSTSMTFAINVPSTVRPGIYLGNCFLVRRNPFDVGAYVDRAAFDLTVS